MSVTTVLLTGIGGPTPRSLARALRNWPRYGSYRIVGVDLNPRALGLYEKYVDVAYIVPPATTGDYWPAIHRIVEAEGIEAALVMPEVEVEAWAAREAAGELPCPALLPPLELVRALRDKGRMAELLAGTPLIPASLPVRRESPNLEIAGKKLSYPYWLRGVKGAAGLGALKIDSLEMARAWLTLNQGISEFSASTYLPGRNIGCLGLFHEGKLLRMACFERLEYYMAKLIPSGISGNISVGRLLNAPEAAEVAQQAIEHVCDALDVAAHGILTTDLKENRDGTPLVTEINVRYVAPVSTLAPGGVNLAEDTVQLTIGNRHMILKGLHHFVDELLILRDMDGEPIVLREEELKSRI